MLQRGQRFLLLIPLLFERLQSFAVTVVLRLQRHRLLRDGSELGLDLFDFVGSRTHASVLVLVSQLQNPVTAGPQPLWRNQAFARLQLRPLGAQILQILAKVNAVENGAQIDLAIDEIRQFRPAARDGTGSQSKTARL